MRLVMMGTGPFAVPTLEALYRSSHQVVALVTRPPRPIHGTQQARVNPMRELARRHDTLVLEPLSVNSDQARAELGQLRADLFVVCDYGQILRKETLRLARLGGINLHASLLPKYRGAAPINWAIYHGEKETGTTVIHMTPELDAGPTLARQSTPIGPEETAADLEPRLAEMGAGLVLKTIDQLADGTAQELVQDSSQASRAPRLKKEDGLIDWRRSAASIACQVRAFQPWPKSYTSWQRTAGEPMRLILERVVPLEENDAREPPAGGAAGLVVKAEGETLVAATGEGYLAVERLQPAGKRVMSAAEFLRGYGLRVGDRFGDTG